MKFVWMFIKSLFIIWSGALILILGLIALPYIIQSAQDTLNSEWLPMAYFLTILVWSCCFMFIGLRMNYKILTQFLEKKNTKISQGENE